MEDESDHIQGDGMKTITPCGTDDFWTELDVLVCLKRSGYSDTLKQKTNNI